MKIKDILNNISNEKKLALGQVLNLSIPEINIYKDKEITKKEYKKYKKIEKELDKGIPLQYITKKAYFYGKEFFVNKNVLIPRPETETLVEETNKLIKSNLNKEKYKILDIGTGSGVIAITLSDLNNNYLLTATDISKKALKVAKKNIIYHNKKIKLIHTDLYKNINEKYDVIISNPPYIETSSKKIEEKVKQNEPYIALYGGEDGLDYYRKILKNINIIINEKHIIAFEIGENQGEKIKEIGLKYLKNDRVIIKKDYNNFDRYIYFISNNE